MNFYVDNSKGDTLKTIRYTPEIQAPGSYKVYAFFPQLRESTTHTPVTVYTGADTVQVQVHKDDVKVVGQTGGERVSVGEYTLPRGREAYVEISNLGTHNTVAADADLLLPIP